MIGLRRYRLSYIQGRMLFTLSQKRQALRLHKLLLDGGSAKQMCHRCSTLKTAETHWCPCAGNFSRRRTAYSLAEIYTGSLA